MLANKKHILITGANRGIGFATTKALASQNTHIIMAVRDTKRGEEAASKLRNEIPTASLAPMPLDLASLASVRSFAQAYISKGYPLHVLINNAAPLSMGKELQYTQDGFELRFGVNHLGHFLLTMLLLPRLKASAPSRIITVSSIRHRQAKTFDFDNLKGEKSYDEGAFYNHTKLANILFTYELRRRLEGSGVSAVAVCPGFVPDTVAASRRGFSRLFFKFLEKMPFARRPEVAANELARAALDDSLEVGGKFFASGKEERSSELSYDVATQQRLWALSEKLTGLEL